MEYKRGRPKKNDADRIQLCAQALCLEEMLHIAVPDGALFYGKTRRREAVPFTDSLRERTRETAAQVRSLLSQPMAPPPEADRRCEHCSLKDICLPHAVNKPAERYIERLCEDV